MHFLISKRLIGQALPGCHRSIMDDARSFQRLLAKRGEELRIIGKLSFRLGSLVSY